ncbi:porin [Noviherbaspirillum agri]
MRDANSFNSGKNGSRLGFKGTEDLGGGLSALFVLESGFQVDSGAMRGDGGLFSRQAYVGLQGGFGTVKLGHQYTPMHLALDAIDPFGTGMAGNIAYQFNNNGTRMSNTINYSYSAAGFTGQAAYGLGEVAGNTGASRQLALALSYANGPLNAQFAYHDANDATDTGDTKTALLGGTYDLQVAKVHAGFQTNKTEAAGVESVKDRNYMLGVSAPVGAGEVRASWMRSDDRLAADADVDQYSVGYVHNLSKRTNVYTSYARFNRDASYDGSIFNVGVQHKF